MKKRMQEMEAEQKMKIQEMKAASKRKSEGNGDRHQTEDQGDPRVRYIPKHSAYNYKDNKVKNVYSGTRGWNDQLPAHPVPSCSLLGLVKLGALAPLIPLPCLLHPVQ